MPDDHYVSQTYLRQFTGEDDRLVPYYKSGQVIVGKRKSPKYVCSEMDGDTNSYFDDTRVLDKYLQPIETAWAENVRALGEGRLDRHQKHSMALYIAYLRMCNPVAKRLGKARLEASLKVLSDKVIKEPLYNSSIPQPPISDEQRALLQKRFEAGELRPDVDIEYAHAISIENLAGVADTLYCCSWLKLMNRTDVPFLTSDNPAVMHQFDDYNPSMSTFVPLSPKLAVVISPDGKRRPTPEELNAHTNGGDAYGLVKRSATKQFNLAVVKAAERVVLFPTAESWIEQLVAKYRDWRVEVMMDELPAGRGVLQLHRQATVDKSSR